MQTFLVILSVIIICIGILGTFLTFLPGLGLSFAGLLVYYFFSANDISVAYLIIFGLLTLLSIALNYLLPIKLTKKYGGSKVGSIGGILGSILGFLFIPIPLGFLIGMLSGVFIGEMLYDKNNIPNAISSTKGAFIGFIYGTGFSLLVSISILLLVMYDIIKA